MVTLAHRAAGKPPPITVRRAIDDYISFLETNRKSAADARYRADALILPPLADVEVEALATDQLRRWHADIAKSPARLRTRNGEAQNHRVLADDDGACRRRRSSANRTLTVLKAALNRAWREGQSRPTRHGGAWSR